MSAHQFAGFSAAARQRVESSVHRVVHVIVIATKPDIIKQFPVYQELAARGELVLLCHTGQHRDFRYSGGMLEEFGLTVDVELGVQGQLHELVAQMIERFGTVLRDLIAAGKTPVPYVHGDTAAAMATGVASYLNRVATVHVEAGIRTLTPRREILQEHYDAYRAGTFDFARYRTSLQERRSHELGSMEPFPEQFNTRVSEASAGFHAAPVELVAGFLRSEGFPADRIEVVGNTVVDATASAMADARRATIFATYPQLRGGDFIRFCVHRRENTSDRHRFTVLFEAMERLVTGGHSVLLISLFGTEQAIDRFGLRARLETLVDDHPSSFIYSEVWPYYRDVVAAMLQCSVVATDSGSMQEEMNILGVPCVTLRFGTDRGESVLAGANVLAPPIEAGFVARVIEGAKGNEEMAGVGNLYGTDAARILVDQVLARISPDNGLFRSEEARIGLDL